MARSRARADKPNIVVIWGDDIGLTNLSCYSNGVMGYRTPNVDRIAREGMELWAERFTGLRVPKIFNLRTDPFERADITSNTYWDWMIGHAYMLVPAQAFVGELLQTFREYPQRQKAASFNLDEVLRKMQEPTHS